MVENSGVMVKFLNLVYQSGFNLACGLFPLFRFSLKQGFVISGCLFFSVMAGFMNGSAEEANDYVYSKNIKNKSFTHHISKKAGKNVYSAPNIEKILENYSKEGKCNRLDCASDLKVAKSCLSSKASHRKHRKCFRAFCAYGCNETDYENNPEIRDFCNKTCSSKKYGHKVQK